MDTGTASQTAPNEVARGTIAKVDAERRLVFGWAYVAKDDGEQVVDHSGEFVPDPDNLENVAIDYVLHSREGDAMHTEPVTSTLVESVVFTPEKAKAMGVAGAPDAGWWVGFKVHSDEVWKRVKQGELQMFSIAGIAEREDVDG